MDDVRDENLVNPLASLGTNILKNKAGPMNIDRDGKDALDCRRALEGLRNGVPNEKAVEMLGCNQSQAEDQFKEAAVQGSRF